MCHMAPEMAFIIVYLFRVNSVNPWVYYNHLR